MLDPSLTTFVVVTHGKSGHERVAWMEPIWQRGFPIVVVHKHDAPCWDGTCNGHPYFNVGCEEFGYASFIVDNYDSLQNDYLFCHHDMLVHVAKHLVPPIPKVYRINRLWQRVEGAENGKFVNFGNYFIATDPKGWIGFPRPDEKLGMAPMPKIFQKLTGCKLPTAFISGQGAHHLVSAERIRSRSRDWWIGFLKLVTETELQIKNGLSHTNIGEIFCRFWEEIYIPREIAAIRGHMTLDECMAWLAAGNSDRLTYQGIEYMSEE